MVGHISECPSCTRVSNQALRVPEKWRCLNSSVSVYSIFFRSIQMANLFLFLNLSHPFHLAQFSP